MILLLDIGNSRIKWATADGTRLQPGDAFEHGGHPASALKRIDTMNIDQAWVSHVLESDAEAPIAEFFCDGC